jgi:hypothetical protein
LLRAAPLWAGMCAALLARTLCVHLQHSGGARPQRGVQAAAQAVQRLCGARAGTQPLHRGDGDGAISALRPQRQPLSHVCRKHAPGAWRARRRGQAQHG